MSGLVPKLRFPEFRAKSTWKMQCLNVLAHVSQGGTPDTAKAEYWGGPINWLTPAEMGKSDDPHVSTTARTITETGLKSCSSELLPPGSIILSTRAPIGYLALNATPIAINQGCKGLVAADGVDPYFLFYSLASARPRLIDLSAGNTFKELSGSALKAFEIPVPPAVAEQRKIAECLTSLDELIAAEGRRLEALRKWKKALLQNLFPREGETTPRLRFPEFRDAGKWEARSLGELLSRGPEYGLNAPAVPYSPELPTYIRITDIGDDGNFLADNKVSVAVDVSDNDYLRGGDIVLARTGASVGKSYRYRPEDGDLVYAGFLIRVRADEALLDSRLLASYLTTPQYWDWVRVTSARSGQPGINGAEYASFPVPLPPPDQDGGISEQHRIASCLGSLDDLIAAQQRKLAALRAHKQGLMQGLFPKCAG